MGCGSVSKVGEADALLENARACVFAQWLGRKQLRPLRRAQLTRPRGWRLETRAEGEQAQRPAHLRARAGAGKIRERSRGPALRSIKTPWKPSARATAGGAPKSVIRTFAQAPKSLLERFWRPMHEREGRTGSTARKVNRRTVNSKSQRSAEIE